jgi:TetR/AcrR family transcriptional repressor of nem operon
MGIDLSGTIVLVKDVARTKEFDEAEVLDRALALFRNRGFRHTSFSDLTGELGVSRQSLYDTYGDKETLYQTALNRYLQRALEGISRTLADPGPVRTVFGGFFEAMISANGACNSSGCFMVNSMVELATSDSATRMLAERHAKEVAGMFEDRLRMAQRKGELARSKDPAAIARFLYCTILGLSVAARAFASEDSLRETAQVALQVLD